MAFAQIYPNSLDASSGTINLASAANVPAALASGGGYIWSQTAGSYVIVGFPNQAMTARAVVLSFGLYTNISADANATIYSYRYGASGPATVYNNTAGAWKQFGGWETAAKGANPNVQPWPLTKADVDAVQVLIQVYAGTGLIEHVRLEVAWVDPCVINAVTPTGTVNTPTPTVSWTYTYIQTQTKYQVRVFSPAQYGIGGFDPATSPATYDSGVVAGNARSAVVSGLEQTSYRAYVRGAETWTRVDGAVVDLWSDWKYTTFNVVLKSINYWDGSVFKTGQVKIYNGAAFVDATNIKIWTGSTWINAVNG